LFLWAGIKYNLEEQILAMLKRCAALKSLETKGSYEKFFVRTP
jgi:hypothetical protein